MFIKSTVLMSLLCTAFLFPANSANAMNDDADAENKYKAYMAYMATAREVNKYIASDMRSRKRNCAKCEKPFYPELYATFKFYCKVCTDPYRTSDEVMSELALTGSVYIGDILITNHQPNMYFPK